MIYRLPIVDAPRQSFRFRLDGVLFTLDLNYNTVASTWFAGLTADGVVLCQGYKVTPDVDLFGEYIGSVIMVHDASNNAESLISYEALVNGNARLYYLTLAEYQALKSA